MAEVSTPGRPVGPPDDRYTDGHRPVTTVLPLRKSFTVWTDPEVEGDDRVGSAPRYRFFPEVVPAGSPGRLTDPPAWHSITRDQLMDFVRTGQVSEDGKVVIDRGTDPADGAFLYSIGEVPEGGNPDEIPLTLDSEV